MNTVVIIGPTAVGKSRLALNLAGDVGGEIVSVDSRQAYRKTDIGTAKPSVRERADAPHHLIDILDLDEDNNANRFAGMALIAIADIVERGRLPILVGGSGLYLRAIFRGFFHIELKREERERFALSLQDVPTDELHRRLVSADPESSRRIHPNDRYRIVRALEVYTLSGIPLSEHFERQRTENRSSDTNHLKIGLKLPRKELYRRINERTIRMIEAGWVEEVERLLRDGAHEDWPGLRTLGYPEVISYIKGELTKKRMIGEISKLTRQYAKRQITWFNKEEGVTWLGADDPDTTATVLSLVEDSFGG